MRLAEGLVAGALVFAVLMVTVWYEGAGARRRAVMFAFVLLVALGGFARIAHVARQTTAEPPAWDFLNFYIYSRVAATTHGVYDTDEYKRAFSRYAPSAERNDTGFTAEAFAVAFPYPPTSIPVVAWLGLMSDYHRAALTWNIVQLAGLPLAAAAFARTFIGAGGLGFGASLAVAALSFGTFRGFTFMQTIGLALLAVCATFAARPRTEGWWIAFGVAVKPFLAILLLIPILRGDWKTLGRSGLGLAVLLALAIAITGPAALVPYLHGQPLRNVLPSVWMEDINISLSAFVLRALYATPPAHITAAVELPFFVAGGAVALATLAAALRAVRTGSSDLARSVTLLCGLLLFPQTLDFYSLLVLAPLGVLWVRGKQHPGGAFAAAGLAGALTAACWFGSGDFAFGVLFVTWCGFVIWSLRAVTPRVPQVTLPHPRLAPAGGS